MAIDFTKFDKQFDLEGLKTDVKDASENETNFKEVPHGIYEVEIAKLELGESKNQDPMFKCWMKIVDGEYEGSMIFMNQVVTRGFQLHIVNEFLRALTENMGMVVEFESFAQYSNLINQIAAIIDEKREYAVEYGERKGFNTFKITEVFDVE